MSSLTSEERVIYLLRVSTFFAVSLILSSFLFISGFLFDLMVRFSDTAGELLLLGLIFDAGVPVPVDAVCTEGSLEASRRDGCGPTQNAGV